jgi:hypothetical protein
MLILLGLLPYKTHLVLTKYFKHWQRKINVVLIFLRSNKQDRHPDHRLITVAFIFDEIG